MDNGVRFERPPTFRLRGLFREEGRFDFFVRLFFGPNFLFFDYRMCEPLFSPILIRILESWGGSSLIGLRWVFSWWNGCVLGGSLGIV